MISNKKKGAALVVTLIVLTALAVVAVAMISNTSLDRVAVTSSANIARAQLAADAGVGVAIAQITEALGKDDRTVTLVADEEGETEIKIETKKPLYTWIASPEDGQDDSSQAMFVPLVSGGNSDLPARKLNELNTIPKLEEIFTDKAADYDEPPTNWLPEELLALFGGVSPKAKLVPIDPIQEPGDEDLDNNLVARYAYWVEDLQGKIDLSIAGGPKPPTPAESRIELPNSPRDIGLFTLFDPDAESNPGNTAADELVANRGAILTPDTVKFLAPEFDYPALHFYSGLGYEEKAPEMIPYGFNFAEAGKPKYALNEILKEDQPNEKVGKIANAISSNLPNFAATRAGGMAPQTYLNNLAANIIDYADADQSPTTDGTYRGIDSYPLVCQWMVRTEYRNRSENGATFAVRHFVELWNMSDQRVAGQISFKGQNGYQPTVGGTLLDFANPGENVNVTRSEIDNLAIALEPNAKKVFDLGETIFSVLTDATPSAQIDFKPTMNFYYSLEWITEKGRHIIDKSIGYGRGVDKDVIFDEQPIEWNAYIPGLIYTQSKTNPLWLNGNLGDPRATFFINAPLDSNDYDKNVGVGGLLVRQSIGSDKSYYGVLPENWPDPSPQEDTKGTIVGSDKKLPTDVEGVATVPTKAISRIANYEEGKYLSVTELGHIFDPGQWQLYSGVELNDAKEAWKDITNGAVADSRFGGGYTLRIGRPEFSRFDKGGSRAGELLSIFSTNSTKSTRGLVNINTASYEALRAMAAGIRMEEGSFKRPVEIYGPKDSEQGDRFAKAVLQSRPFYSTHELSTKLNLPPVDGSEDSFFGNPNQWQPDARPIVWRDAAAEDYFRKIYDLATVSSRNFRIHAFGQVLNQKSGKVVAQAYKTCDVYFRAVRNEQNPLEITSFIPVRIYEKTE